MKRRVFLLGLLGLFGLKAAAAARRGTLKGRLTGGGKFVPTTLGLPRA